MAKQLKVSAMHPKLNKLQIGVMVGNVVKFADGTITDKKNVVKHFAD
jgi:hypothetical protein